jgi:hypothetical protein
MSDLFDKAKNLLAENSDTVDDVVDKLAGLVDDKTGGKHKKQVADGAEKAKDAIAGFVGADDASSKPKQQPGAKKPGAKQPGAKRSADRGPDAAP